MNYLMNKTNALCRNIDRCFGELNQFADPNIICARTNPNKILVKMEILRNHIFLEDNATKTGDDIVLLNNFWHSDKREITIGIKKFFLLLYRFAHARSNHIFLIVVVKII